MSMLKSTYQYSNCGDVVDLLKTVVPEVRSLFKQVETLLRLLLVVPASSSQAERSFSALRRLKTWLRTNMTQKRLNHVAVCHVHRDRLDRIDRKQVCKSLIAMSDIRKNVFGSF